MNYNYYLGPWQKTPMQIGRFLWAWTPPEGAVGLIDLRSDRTQPDYGFFALRDDVTPGSEYRLFGQGYITEVVPPESDRAVFASMLGMPTVLGDTLMDWLWHACVGRPWTHPLMPNDGWLNAHLGGHSLVRRKRFDLTIPEAAGVIATLQADYERARADARDNRLGRSVDGVFVPDTEHHRKMLDFWGEKFRINNPEDVFIRKGLPPEKRLKHSTSHSDNFGVANNETLSGQQTWTENGNWATVSNEAVLRAGPVGAARCDADVSSSDMEVSILVKTLTDTGPDPTAGPIARIPSGAWAETYYLSDANAPGAVQNMLVFVAGSPTVLASVGITLALPEAYKIRCVGTDISQYQAGVQRGSTVTDMAIPGNTRGGIFGEGTNGNTIVDDYLIADVVVGGPFPHFTRRRMTGGLPVGAF